MLLEMLKYRRPEGSKTQAEFCARFLEPVFGPPDPHGNYIHTIGNSEVAFMAHHDTVHRQPGIQSLTMDPNFQEVFTNDPDSNCLGADCTTGVWLILQMIKAKVPGIYVIHAGEEIGCVGSRAIVDDAPLWLETTRAAISFDRKGTKSIITHQMDSRTASDEFAHSLAQILDMPLQPDPTGSYTDSNEYAHIIPECTNLSVGYYEQHSTKECQDLNFAKTLAQALIKADWSQLTIARTPALPSSRSHGNFPDEMYDYVYQNPDVVASFLEDYGIEIDEIEGHYFFNRSAA